jgi:hypothetical protein
MDVTDWANSTTLLTPRSLDAHEKPIRKGLDAIQAHLLAKVEAIFAEQSRREEMQRNSIPQHWAWLQANRDVIVVQHFQSGPIKSLGTVQGTDPAITSRLGEIVMESIEAMFEAGEPVGFVTTDLARIAAGLVPENAT